MHIDFGKLGTAGGRWLLLIAVAVGAFFLVEAAVHPMMKAAPFAKSLSALIGYGLVVLLVCVMRWSPFQPILAPLFDEITHLARIAMTGKEGSVKAEPMVRAGAMIAVAVYGGLTFSAIVLAGAMLAGVSH